MDYYTYIYYDPSRNNEPIYVGKGKNGRAWKHLQRKDMHPFTQRLQFMKKHGVIPVIGIYGSMDNELAMLVEEELIVKFGRKDLGKGTLLNLTDGGEGIKGNHTPKTEEHKCKIRQTKAENPEARGTGNRGKILSTETKLKMSAASRGKSLSDAHKESMRAAWKLRVMRSPPNKGIPMSDEQKLKISNTKRLKKLEQK